MSAPDAMLGNVIAWALQGTSDPAEAVAGWMSSPGHCANIMNPAFHVTGIGYALGDGGPRWTQDFAGSH